MGVVVPAAGSGLPSFEREARAADAKRRTEGTEPAHPADPVEIARLSSALDRAAIRARVAVQRGDWGVAAAAATEAERLKAELDGARRAAGGGANVPGRVRVKG